MLQALPYYHCYSDAHDPPKDTGRLRHVSWDHVFFFAECPQATYGLEGFLMLLPAVPEYNSKTLLPAIVPPTEQMADGALNPNPEPSCRHSRIS